MYRHMVFMSFKEDATDEVRQKCIDGLRSLGTIPDVTQVLVEPNDSRDQTYSHVLIVDCADKAAFQRYSAHPLHHEVIENAYRPAVGNRAMANIAFGA
jgi:hypothetical protein